MDSLTRSVSVDSLARSVSVDSLARSVSVDSLVVALGPAFAAGFAVQQFLEILEQFLFVILFPFMSWLVHKNSFMLGIVNKIKGNADRTKMDEEKIKIYKKAGHSLASFIIGFLLAFGAGLRVLRPLGVQNAGNWDLFVTGLIISSGTEGVNSIMKFLGYTKEKAKPEKQKEETKKNGKATSQQETAE
jgi:hypothetical protein